MKRYLEEFALSMIAYCLMPNHYHFLVRQDGNHRSNLLPQRVFNSYSKAYNKRYGHSGTLFEGSYRVKKVVESPHLLHLCRYIHGNPVKDGLVSDPDDWPYSNFPEWVGKRDGTMVDQILFVSIFQRQPFTEILYSMICAEGTWNRKSRCIWILYSDY